MPALVEIVPELQEALDEHLSWNHEVLQHVFFACELVPFALNAWASKDTAVLNRCLGFLEAAMTGPDPDTRNLVAVSFVEQVGPWDPDVAAFIATWPPALAHEAAAQC